MLVKQLSLELYALGMSGLKATLGLLVGRKPWQAPSQDEHACDNESVQELGRMGLVGK